MKESQTLINHDELKLVEGRDIPRWVNVRLSSRADRLDMLEHTSSSSPPVYFDPNLRWNYARPSSLDPFQTSILTYLELTRQYVDISRGILKARLDGCSQIVSILGCPDHPDQVEHVPHTCKIRICNKDPCKRQRYKHNYSRIKSIGEYFEHRGFRPHRKDSPMLLTLPIKSHAKLSKSRKSAGDRCARQLVKHFKLKGFWVMEQKLKPDGLFHYHYHLLCDNDYVVKRDISAYWKKITKKEGLPVSKVSYVNRAGFYYAINYMTRRLSHNLGLNYDPASVDSDYVLSEYINHVRNKNFFVVFGYSKEMRKRIKLGLRASLPIAVCPICNKPMVWLMSCLNSELNLYSKPGEKIEVIEHVPSVSHILISEINGGET